MASQPIFPPPDIVQPQAPAESPGRASPDETPMVEPPGIAPLLPDMIYRTRPSFRSCSPASHESGGQNGVEDDAKSEVSD